MQLVDALVTVAGRHHVTWALTVDDIVLLRRGTPESAAEYVVRVMTDPPNQLWAAVIATPQPGDTVMGTLEEALAWLVAEGYRDSLVSDRWLTTAHGAA